MDVPPTVFPVVEPRDLAPQLYDNAGWLRDSTPIEIDNNGAVDVVSYVLTFPWPDKSYAESTLCLLTVNKLLDASDYEN